MSKYSEEFKLRVVKAYISGEGGNFTTTKSNEKWVTDVTQFNLFGTKLYLSPILDLHDQSLISWNISESPNYAQTVDMLEKAFKKIPDETNLILHSDQAWNTRCMIIKGG